MASRTVLGVDEARRALADYGLTLERLTPLPALGTVNTNFRVRAHGGDGAAGDYFLRLNEGRDERAVRDEAELVAWLRARGVATPAILRTRAGALYGWAAGRPTTLFPWLDGSDAVARAREPALLAALGGALATLHRAGAERDAATLPENQYSLDELERRLAGFAADARFADVAPALARELAAARARRAAAPLPSGLIHQDLFPDNVLLDGEGCLAALLDFEQATFGAFVYDLGVCLNEWCWDGGAIDAAAAEALIAGYDAVRPLEAREHAALPAELRLSAARFTITRITDVFLPAGVDPDLRRRKDYRDYAVRLSWWTAEAISTWSVPSGA